MRRKMGLWLTLALLLANFQIRSADPIAPPTPRPTGQPSSQPSRQPTGQPSTKPSSQPSAQPSRQPTGQPTAQPSRQPTGQPSTQPSSQPTGQPSQQPTAQPSLQPVMQPSAQPSQQPTGRPSAQPSQQPTSQPSAQPSTQPTSQPSRQPTEQPSTLPSSQPSGQPSQQPIGRPSAQPSQQPSSKPSRQPTSQPSRRPSRQPSSKPTRQPSRQPSGQPSRQPTTNPTNPTGQPSSQPSRQPSRQPSGQPTAQPVGRPTSRPSSGPTSAKYSVITKVTQRFSGISIASYKDDFCYNQCGVSDESGCTSQQYAYKQSFDQAIRQSVQAVMGLTSLRYVQISCYLAVVRRRRLGESRLLADSDAISVAYTVQTSEPGLTGATVAAKLQSATDTGSFGLLLKTFVGNSDLRVTLAKLTPQAVVKFEETKTASPVITPTASPTVQTAAFWLQKWYVPWSVACAVLGVLLIYGSYRLYWYRQKRYEEAMEDLANRQRVADELLAKRFAPGVTKESAPHIVKMRDNFKRQYGKDPNSRSPYDDAGGRDMESFYAQPSGDKESYYDKSDARMPPPRGGGAGKRDSPRGARGARGGGGNEGGGGAGEQRMRGGRSPSSPGRDDLPSPQPQPTRLYDRRASPRSKMTLQLGSPENAGGRNREGDDGGMAGDGLSSPSAVAALPPAQLKQAALDEREKNTQLRFTLVLPARETTARMQELLSSKAPPSAKEATILTRYLDDLTADNAKLMRQLAKAEKTRGVGGYGRDHPHPASSGAGRVGSPPPSSEAGSLSYAPQGINRDALGLKRSYTTKAQTVEPSRKTGSPRDRL